jgi:hypothetical protein
VDVKDRPDDPGQRVAAKRLGRRGALNLPGVMPAVPRTATFRQTNNSLLLARQMPLALRFDG